MESLESRLMMAADFGDAPLPYRTLLAENGARHDVAGPSLGNVPTMEADGAHNPTASGDVDDGVTMGNLRVGQLGASATVNVQNAPGGAKLDAWIDFNGDGVWGGPGEQIANNRTVAAGDNVVMFDIPGTALSGNVFARFRLSTAGNLTPTGTAVDGEVEDYQLAISPPGTASGSFTTERSLSTTITTAISTVAADVDGDGDMDVVAGGVGTGAITWFENNGSEVFTARSVGTGDTMVRQIAVADLDGDGDMDVVTASNSPGKVAWYENNGSETFTAREVGVQAGAFSVFVIDVDGDGDNDVAAAAGNRIYWFDNNGSQTFTSKQLTGAANAANSAYSVFAADVDGDGDVDLLSASSADDKVAWYENNGSQTFTQRVITTAADGARSVFAADLDKDGDMDVLSAAEFGDQIAWYENNGSQVFTPHTISSGADGAWSVYAADMDGDGDLDVLSASWNDDEVTVYRNDGGMFATRIISTSGNASRSVVAADVDGDGDLDVVAASTADNSVVWYANKPSGDYDQDSDIDGGDFLLWQRDFGATVAAGTGADGNTDTKVDALDLALWRAGFGAQASNVASAAFTLSSASVGSSSANLTTSGGESASEFGAAGANWFVAIEPLGFASRPGAALVSAPPYDEPASRDAVLDSFGAAPHVHSRYRAAKTLTEDREDGLAAELIDNLFADWRWAANLS